MRLFAQLSWYFRREWQRYLGAVLLLIIIAILQLIPPKVVGYVVDGVTEQHYTTARVLMWVGTLVLTAVIVYLLRYVWRVLLFGASISWPLSCARILPSAESPAPRVLPAPSHGDLIARATNDVDRVVFAAGEGVLTLVDSLVMGCAVLIVMSTQISWQLTLLALLPMPLMALAINRYGEQLHERFKLAQAAFSSLNDRTQESMTSIRMIKAFGLEDRQSALFAADAADTGAKTCALRVLMRALIRPSISLLAWPTCWPSVAELDGGAGHLDLGQLTSFAMYGADDLADAGAGPDV